MAMDQLNLLPHFITYSNLSNRVLQATTVVIYLSATHSWTRCGFGIRARFSHLALLVFPVFLLSFRFSRLNIGSLFCIDNADYFLISIFVAFTEESIFRGVLIAKMHNKSQYMPFLISSLFFGVIHVFNISSPQNTFEAVTLFLYAFAGGLGLASIRIRTNTVWYGILWHAIYNYTNALHRLSENLYDGVHWRTRIPPFVFVFLFSVYGWLILPDKRLRNDGTL